MPKKKFILIGIGIVAVVIPLMLLNTEEEPTSAADIEELDFTYNAANTKLQQNLGSLGVSMSSPINIINKNMINEHCTFFSQSDKQEIVDFCTSTELKDSDGKFLGNIHMVGSRSMPKIILAIIQSNPFMNNIDQVKLVYDSVITDLVCDCWEDFKPSGIETISEWVEKQRTFHLSETKPTSTSTLKLMGKTLQMELTTNQEGYLWKLIISE